MSGYIYHCRNRVYRQGIVKRCNRPSIAEHCDHCSEALNEQKLRILGLTEAKKEPSNKPDDLDVDEDFEVHDGYDEDKKGPDKPGKQKRKSSLQDGPEGEKGSKKSPYLKENADGPSHMGTKGRQVDKTIYDRWGPPGTKLGIDSARGILQYYQNAGLPQSKAPITRVSRDQYELVSSQWPKTGPMSTAERTRRGLRQAGPGL